MVVKQNRKAHLSYAEALSYLHSLQFHKIKLGLEPMRDFLGLLGNPESGLQVIHVAGTNGKGSVCSGLSSVLQQSGYSVAMYTSPHLSSPRERFKIDQNFISKEDFCHFTQIIRATLAGRSITYFEFTTALAFLWFNEQEVDLVLLETGLGGRLDATNVVTSPLLTIITSISLDHQAYLGDTIEEVASEKAGIIKSYVPLICGNRQPEIVAVIQNFCECLSAPLYLLGQDFDFSWEHQGEMSYVPLGGLGGKALLAVESATVGRYQAENSSLVIAATTLLTQKGFVITENDIRAGLLAVHWPGRLEYFEQDIPGTTAIGRYLLDGAHNPAGIESLVHALSLYSYKKLFCIWGAMEDKDVAGGLQKLCPIVDCMILTGIDNERAAVPEKMMRHLKGADGEHSICCDTVEDALHYAQSHFSEDDLILVAGSLYLIGALRPLLLGELV